MPSLNKLIFGANVIQFNGVFSDHWRCKTQINKQLICPVGNNYPKQTQKYTN